MKAKKLIIPGLMVAVACAIAVAFVREREAAQREAALERAKAQRAAELARAKAASAVREVAPEVPVVHDITPPPAIPSEPVVTRIEPQQLTVQTQKTLKAAQPAKDPVTDHDARIALSLVGMDPDAEAYWLGAINDPNLSAKERQDLIEDLNEEGLSDPKHPTVDDLPLILGRLQIIELIGTDAMDQVNADAFEEAYKDLRNLVHLAIGGGEPVN